MAGSLRAARGALHCPRELLRNVARIQGGKLQVQATGRAALRPQHSHLALPVSPDPGSSQGKARPCLLAGAQSSHSAESLAAVRHQP